MLGFDGTLRLDGLGAGSLVLASTQRFFADANRNQGSEERYAGNRRIISSDLRYSVEDKGSREPDVGGGSRFITPAS